MSNSKAVYQNDKVSAIQVEKQFEQVQLPYVVNADVTVNDVLLGRGDHSVRHEGNIRFREVIQKHQDMYFMHAGDNNSMKTKIARPVINIVEARKGRFLRKATAQEIDQYNIPTGSKPWIPISTNTVSLIKKIKQAFRDKREQSKKGKNDNKDNIVINTMPFLSARQVLTDTSVSTEYTAMASASSALMQRRNDVLLQQNTALLQCLHLLETLERRRLEQELFRAATNEVRLNHHGLPILLRSTSNPNQSNFIPDSSLLQGNKVYSNVLASPLSSLWSRQTSMKHRDIEEMNGYNGIKPIKNDKNESWAHFGL